MVLLMKKLLWIVVLGLLLSGNAYAKDLNVIWNIELDNGKTYKVRLEDGNFCKFVDTYGGAGCSYTSNGNKVFINDNNSVFILKGSRSYFSNKIKGTWKSNHTNNQGKFWGYEEKIK
tara:strand:+ start:28 stop:378 length:351 start_codon:yes stop_codon:yes gene_type:complete